MDMCVWVLTFQLLGVNFTGAFLILRYGFAPSVYFVHCPFFWGNHLGFFFLQYVLWVVVDVYLGTFVILLYF